MSAFIKTRMQKLISVLFLNIGLLHADYRLAFVIKIIYLVLNNINKAHDFAIRKMFIFDNAV